MKTFADLQSLDMTWVKGKRPGWFKPIPYQLMDDSGQVLATITHGNSAAKATVDAPGNRWIFERKFGWFKSSIRITSVGTGEQPASYILRGNAGVLTYPDGREFHWKAAAWFSGRKWIWTDADGTPILGIELRGAWQQRGEVHIDPNINVEKAPPLLLFLGWYLILLHQSDTAAAAAAVVAASG